MGEIPRVTITFLGGGKAGQVLELAVTHPLSFGRRPENDIAFDVNRDLDVSGLHAELRTGASGELVLVDLGSRNGLYVAGRRVGEVVVGTRGLEVGFGANGPRLRISLAQPPPPAPVALPAAPELPPARSASRSSARASRLGLRAGLLVLVLGLGGLGALLLARSLRAPAGDRGERAGSVVPARATATITPGRPLSLEVGVARIEVSRGALAQAGALHAELSADRSLTLELRPPQPLHVPASVVLPLPPGADPDGVNGPRAPVVLLESPGADPLVLLPERASRGGITVEVPHFSRLRPGLVDDVRGWLERAGKQLAALTAANAPRDLKVVRITRPESYGTDERLGTLVLDVQAVTSSGKPPDETNSALFAGLKVRATRADGRELASATLKNGAGELTVAPGESTPAAGQPPVLSVVLTLLTGSGHIIASRTIIVPAGPLWASHDCLLAGKKQFVIWYLRPKGFADDSDQGYRGSAPSGALPARVLDTCTVLTTVFPIYRDKEFRDPDNAPGELTVWLQPWKQSNSGAVRNWVSVKTSGETYDEFKITVAHELAHRFQHQYSLGLFEAGGWYHDASAEYLAVKVHGATDDVGAFTAGSSTDWLPAGLMTGSDVEAYGWASFLAYLADRYKLGVARLWVDASNLRSWAGALDKTLVAGGSSLSKAFAEFAPLWLLDHGGWGKGWGAAAIDRQLESAQRAHQYAFRPGVGGRKPKVRVTASHPIPWLSAAGLLLSWRAAAGESALIAGTVSFPAGPGGAFLVPGEQVRGAPGRALAGTAGGQIAGGEEKLGLVLGTAKGALDPRAARVVYWYSDWGVVTSQSGTLEVDLWVLPQPIDLKLGVDKDRKKLLSWKPSPLEQEQELIKGYRVTVLDAKGIETPLALTPAGTTELVLDKVPAGAQQVCVRVQDKKGHESPEACTSLTRLLCKLASVVVRQASWKQVGICRYIITPCGGRPPFTYVWSIENGPKQPGGESRDFPCWKYFVAEVTDADGMRGVVSLFSGGVCP